MVTQSWPFIIEVQHAIWHKLRCGQENLRHSKKQAPKLPGKLEPKPETLTLNLKRRKKFWAEKPVAFEATFEPWAYVSSPMVRLNMRPEP